MAPLPVVPVWVNLKNSKIAKFKQKFKLLRYYLIFIILQSKVLNRMITKKVWSKARQIIIFWIYTVVDRKDWTAIEVNLLSVHNCMCQRVCILFGGICVILHVSTSMWVCFMYLCVSEFIFDSLYLTSSLCNWSYIWLHLMYQK